MMLSRCYAWNIELAAALQGATAMVEVVTCNAIDQAFTSWYRKSVKTQGASVT